MASKARIDVIVAPGLLCEPVNGVVNRMWPGQYTSHPHHTHIYTQTHTHPRTTIIHPYEGGEGVVITSIFPRDDFI